MFINLIAFLAYATGGAETMTTNTQNADYTFTSGDMNNIVRHNESTPRTYTIPTRAQVTAAVGSVVIIRNTANSGAITLAQPSDGAVQRADGVVGYGVFSIGANSQVAIILDDATTNTWYISGPFSVAYPAIGATPVGYWPLNDGSGSSAADLSGNGNVGTVVGSPTWITGKFGNALAFNGTSSYVSLGSPSALNITGAFTVSAWINNTTASGTRQVVSRGIDASGQSQPYYLEFIGSVVHFGLFQSNVTHEVTYSGTSIMDGNWHHICGVADGTNIKLYFDGVKVASISDSTVLVSSATPTVIGANYVGTNSSYGGFFAGSIDDVRIYSSGFNDTQVFSLANLVP